MRDSKGNFMLRQSDGQQAPNIGQVFEFRPRPLMNIKFNSFVIFDNGTTRTKKL